MDALRVPLTELWLCVKAWRQETGGRAPHHLTLHCFPLRKQVESSICPLGSEFHNSVLWCGSVFIHFCWALDGSFQSGNSSPWIIGNFLGLFLWWIPLLTFSFLSFCIVCYSDVGRIDWFSNFLVFSLTYFRFIPLLHFIFFQLCVFNLFFNSFMKTFISALKFLSSKSFCSLPFFLSSFLSLVT